MGEGAEALQLAQGFAVGVEYWPTPDPSLTDSRSEQILEAHRSVRDGLFRRIKALPADGRGWGLGRDLPSTGCLTFGAKCRPRHQAMGALAPSVPSMKYTGPSWD